MQLHKCDGADQYQIVAVEVVAPCNILRPPDQHKRQTQLGEETRLCSIGLAAAKLGYLAGLTR